LRPLGFTVIAVAIDHSADDVPPFVDGITMPVLCDPNYVLTGLYAISNVQTVVWIDEEATRRHVARASELAPDDLTIWRAGMPLVGEDPTGDAFFVKYEEWNQKGSPFHGLPAVRGPEPAT
jgi:hypothetical protein